MFIQCFLLKGFIKVLLFFYFLIFTILLEIFLIFYHCTIVYFNIIMNVIRNKTETIIYNFFHCGKNHIVEILRFWRTMQILKLKFYRILNDKRGYLCIWIF